MNDIVLSFDLVQLLKDRGGHFIPVAAEMKLES